MQCPRREPYIFQVVDVPPRPTTQCYRVEEARRPRAVALLPCVDPVRRTQGDHRGGDLRSQRQCKELGSRRFGAEEAVGWAVSRQIIKPVWGPPRSQPETRVPLRPDAIDRKVRLIARAPPPL